MARKVTYGMQVTLDGFIAGPNGELDWANVDEALHRHFNDLERSNGLLAYGRRLYETMAAFWPTADQDPAQPDVVHEYARIWRDKPKVVFSNSLERVDWNSRLVRGDAAEEIARLKSQAGGDISVGGAVLAASLLQRGLVDECQLYVNPVVLGSGQPAFPGLAEPHGFRLAGTHTFDNGVVLLRYSSLGRPD
jgi:dihydrofolate reductase